MIFLILILSFSACTSLTDESLTVDCTSNCEQTALSVVQEGTPEDTLNINQNSNPEQAPAADDDAAAYTSPETPDITDADGEPMTNIDADDDAAAYTPPEDVYLDEEAASTATLPSTETPTVVTSTSEQTSCAEYYAWDHAYGDSVDDIDPEFVEVTSLSDCILEIDSDGDGLSRKIDPDDNKQTEWHEVKPRITNSGYALAITSNTVVHYRYIPTPLSFTNNPFTGSETETYGITNWSKASDARTSCGSVYSERGICIIWSSKMFYINPIDLETTIQDYEQTTKKSNTPSLIIRQPVFGN